MSTVQTEHKYMITMGDYNINTLKFLKTPTQNKDRDEFSNSKKENFTKFKTHVMGGI